MKYRRLSKEELENLESDFVNFLAAQQIPAPEWENLKTSNPAKIEELLDLFSDIVLEKVMNKIEYLQHRSPDALRVFRFAEEKIIMTGLKLENSTADLTKPETLAKLSEPGGIDGMVKIFQVEKPYSKPKPEEVFGMTQNYNCQTASKEMFDGLVAMYEQTIEK